MSDVSISSLEAHLAKLRDRVDYQGIMLGLLCALVTLLLLSGERLTSDEIQLRLAEDRAALLQELLPSDRHDNDPLQDSITISDETLNDTPTEVYLAKAGQKVTAAIYQFTTAGWGGDINLMIALDEQGAILGLRVLNHKETPGLADKIETDKSNWIITFNGKSLANTTPQEWRVKKDGGTFDQFTGATITPRAVVGGVYQALEFFARHKGTIFQVEESATQPVDENSSKETSKPVKLTIAQLDQESSRE